MLDGGSFVSSVFEFHRDEPAFSDEEASWMQSACQEWANVTLEGIADKARLMRNRKMSEFLMGVVKYGIQYTILHTFTYWQYTAH